MLKVRPGVTLPVDALARLATLQAKVDSEANYAERVKCAKLAWESAKKSEAAFDAVKRTLSAMCWGRRRCVYCEDSSADEIEHLWPKALYPERVFVWENYLYACGPCNGPKGNAFAVFPPGSDTAVEVGRKKGDPVVPPRAGDPVLLDPRVDNPLEYLTLSLGVPVDQGGYRFVERPAPGTRAWERAHYTIHALGLNRRNDVIEGRADAYEALRRALDEIQSCLEHGRSLDGPRSTIRHTPHRSVWEEMKRSSIAEINLRFARVPTEVLDW